MIEKIAKYVLLLTGVAAALIAVTNALLGNQGRLAQLAYLILLALLAEIAIYYLAKRHLVVADVETLRLGLPWWGKTGLILNPIILVLIIWWNSGVPPIPVALNVSPSALAASPTFTITTATATNTSTQIGTRSAAVTPTLVFTVAPSRTVIPTSTTTIAPSRLVIPTNTLAPTFTFTPSPTLKQPGLRTLIPFPNNDFDLTGNLDGWQSTGNVKLVKQGAYDGNAAQIGRASTIAYSLGGIFKQNHIYVISGWCFAPPTATCRVELLAFTASNNKTTVLGVESIQGTKGVWVPFETDPINLPTEANLTIVLSNLSVDDSNVILYDEIKIEEVSR